MIIFFLFKNFAFAKKNISRDDFFIKITENGNTGFVLRYHNEKNSSKFEGSR